MDDLDFGSTIKGFATGQKVFGRYTLSRILGRGGMGVVWLARDDKLEREVALKFLPEVLMGDKVALADLKRETRRSLDLTHSHIVRIYDFVEDGRTAAIAMEYITGETLTNARAERPGHCYEPADIAKWVGQICDALDYAHVKAKVVHRDLKPANLMIDAAGDVKVTDFGIATSIADSVSRVSRQAGSSGTPVYMAPQQMMGEKPAVTDDIYALGAALYDLLTGKPPFHSGNIVLQVQDKVAPPMSERRQEFGLKAAPLPPAWEQTIAACLAKEPADRPQSAGEVAERLGLGANAQRSTLNAQRPIAEKVERDLRARSASISSARSAENPPKSKTPLYAGLAAALVLLGGLGWYFGLHAPEQQRLAAEQARQQEITRQAEQKSLTERARQAEEQRLANLRLSGKITTDPAGAEVRVDDDITGLSPLARADFKLGAHTVHVRLDGYEDLVEKITVVEKGANEWGYKLVRSTGALALSALPAGPAKYQIHAAGKGGAEAVAEGNLPAEVTLPTGRYEFRAERPGWSPAFSRLVEVKRGESLPLTADLRGGRITVKSTPAGAAVYRGGVSLGPTPLTVDDIGFNQPVDLELRLDRYRPEKHTLTIPDADHPQIWEATLQLKPLLALKPDFTKGPVRLRVTKQHDYQIKGQTQTGTTVTPMKPEHYQGSSSSVYELSDPGRDGQWNAVLAHFESLTGTIPDANRIKPGSIIRFQRNFSNEWSGKMMEGSAVSAQQPPALTPSYAGLWLSPDVWPQGEASAGATWDVPVRAAPALIPGLKLRNPQGAIRARLISFDRDAAQPWADVECSFELNGDVDLPNRQIPAGMSETGSGSVRGTLRLRIEVAAGYVSHAVLDLSGRTQIRDTPLAGSGSTGGAVSLFGSVAAPRSRQATPASAPAATELVVDTDSKLEVSAAPYDGPVNISQEAPAAPQPTRLVFFREKVGYVGGGSVTLKLDDAVVGKLSNGTYWVKELAPGAHTVAARVLGIELLKRQVQLEEGATTYLEMIQYGTGGEWRTTAESEALGKIAVLEPDPTSPANLDLPAARPPARSR